MEVLALADDLTGALETGAKFAASGVEAFVTAGPTRDNRAAVVVVDTETRHVPPRKAAARIAECGLNARLVYKKTDSTLRGNIGAELGALLAFYPDSPLIYAPAYPAMGRVVKQGYLFVHGKPAHESEFAKDALNPVLDSDIARVLRSQTEARIYPVSAAQLGNLAAGAIYVCDGESDQDIAEAAHAMIANGYRLAAGPAAFAEAIAKQADLPRRPVTPWPQIHSCLVINGSRHELSSRQVCHAVDRGWRIARAGEITQPGWVILDDAATSAGSMVNDILSHVKFDALAVFGGDTAFGALVAIGNPPLYPLGEIVPGVPLSRVSGWNLHLITKAGGFGPAGVLSAIRSALL